MGPLKQRKGGPGKEPMDSLDRLTLAALAYADAESDEEFDRARNNLLDAAEWYALGIPKRHGLQAFGCQLIVELRARAKAGLRAPSSSIPFPRPSPLRPSLLASWATQSFAQTQGAH